MFPARMWSAEKDAGRIEIVGEIAENPEWTWRQGQRGMLR